MTKQEFDKIFLDELISCKTKRLAKKFLKLADSVGYKWRGGRSLLKYNNWYIYKKKTGYRVSDDGISYGCAFGYPYAIDFKKFLKEGGYK